MQIVVDHRIGSKELLPLFPSGRALLSTCDLDADCVTLGYSEEQYFQVGFERKRLSGSQSEKGDFLQSFLSNRLHSQLENMLEKFRFSYLLIEDHYWAEPASGDLVIQSPFARMKQKNGMYYWKYSALESILNSFRLYAPGRFFVLQTSGMKGTVDLILSLQDFYMKFDEHQSIYGAYMGEGIKKSNPAAFGKKVLSLVRGVRWKLANQLFDQIGSTENVLKALLQYSEIDWAKFKGIGNKTAKILANVKKS